MKKLYPVNPQHASCLSRQNPRRIRNSHPACRKRLRFGDIDTADYLVREKDDMAPAQRILSTKSTEAKTSEYAFFKKIKGDASRRFLPQSGEFVSGSAKSSNGVTRDGCEDLNSSSPVNKVTPNCETQISDLINARKISRNEFSSILEDTETHGGNFKSMGSYEHKGVFLNKRKEPNQWVSGASSPAIDDFHWNGGFFPNNENDHLKEPLSESFEADTKLKSLALPEPDIYIEEPYQRFLEIDDVQYLDNKFSNRLYSGASERMSSRIESMTYHSVKAKIQYSPTESVCEFGGSCPVSSSRVSTFDLPGKGHESASGRIKELDEYCDLSASQREREPISFLPGCDNESMADEQYFPIPSKHAALQSSWANYLDNGLENAFGATKFCSSSFLFISPSNSVYSMHSGLANHDKSVTVVSNHISHSILPEPNCLCLPTDCDFNNEFESNCVLLSPENRKWFMDKVLSETGVNQSPGLGIELGVKCLEHAASSDVYQPPSISTLPALPSSLFIAQDEQTDYMDSYFCEVTGKHFVLESLNAPKFRESSPIYFQVSLNRESPFHLPPAERSTNDSEDVCFL